MSGVHEWELTYVKQFFGSVKQINHIYSRWETDFQFHNFFHTVASQYWK